jgi:hypothetical protein
MWTTGNLMVSVCLLACSAEAFAPLRTSRGVPLGCSPVSVAPRIVAAPRTAPEALDATTADAIFGVAFFTLFSLSGILFIKSAFYEAQDEGSILEGDPFSAVGQRLPFGSPRLTEEQALQKAEDISAELRMAIAEREYPTALKLKRELANLMIDYRIDYNSADDLPEGTDMSPEGQPTLERKRPSFLNEATSGSDGG